MPAKEGDRKAKSVLEEADDAWTCQFAEGAGPAADAGVAQTASERAAAFRPGSPAHHLLGKDPPAPVDDRRGCALGSPPLVAPGQPSVRLRRRKSAAPADISTPAHRL